MDTPSIDPPAYTATMAAAPTTMRRSVSDTRKLILANANIIRPPGKTEGDIELVIGKARDHTTSHNDRRFHSYNSNVTIRIAGDSDEENANNLQNTTSAHSIPGANNDSDGNGSGNSNNGNSHTTIQQQAQQALPAGGNTTRAEGRHYAALVSRNSGTVGIDVIMLGEPQDCVEEALEWLLDRTEIVITEMLSRHRRQARPRCCAACASSTSGGRR